MKQLGATALVLLALAAVAPAANAALPGANGRIAVWSVTPQGDRGNPQPWLISLVTIGPDGSNPEVFDVAGDWDAGLAWSPDGTRLAYAEEAGPIRIVRGDGSAVRTIDVLGLRFGLAWSPRGGRLLFSREIGAKSNLFAVRAGGAGLRRLLRYGGYDTSPSWSSRGRIAFIRELIARDESFAGAEVFTVRPNGRGLRRVTHDSGGRFGKGALDWSPNGRAIVYERQAGPGTGLFRIRPNGRGRRRLAREGRSPAWSPNGRRIAYLGPLGLYTMRADGRDKRLLLHYPEGAPGDDPPFFASPSWQPLP